MDRIQQIKQEICEVGLLLYNRGYVVMNDGNISVRTGENEIIITPAGVGKGRMAPDMMVTTNLEGEILEGNRYPSSEIKMHLEVYKNRPDVKSVVHAHSPAATALAVAHISINARYLPETLLGLGEVPVAEFGVPSTTQVPDSIKPYLVGHNAVLLANHGALAWSADLWSAFDKMEALEFAAKTQMNVRALGGGIEIPQPQMEHILSLKNYYAGINNIKR